MSEKPTIPLVQAIAETLNLNYHRRVAGWYVVGQGACAKSMAEVLQKLCQQKPAYLFDEQTAALHHAASVALHYHNQDEV